MHKMMELRDKLMDEIEQQASRQLTEQSLGLIDKLAHSIKCIDTVIAMDIEGEYGESRDGYSGRRYRDEYSGRRRDNGGTSRRRRTGMDGYSVEYSGRRRDYSRDEAKDKMIEELEGMMGSVSPDAQMAIDRAIHALNQE